MSNGVWSQTDFRNARDFALGKMRDSADLLVIRINSERNDVFSGGAIDRVTIESFSGGNELASKSGLIRREYLEDLVSAMDDLYSPFANLEKFLKMPNTELRIEMSKSVVDALIKGEKLWEEFDRAGGVDAEIGEADKVLEKIDKNEKETRVLMADPKNYKVYLHDTQTGKSYDLRSREVIEEPPSLISKQPEPTEKKKPKKPLRA